MTPEVGCCSGAVQFNAEGTVSQKSVEEEEGPEVSKHRKSNLNGRFFFLEILLHLISWKSTHPVFLFRI